MLVSVPIDSRAYSVIFHTGSGKSSCSSWARWPTSRDSLWRCSKRMAAMATGGRPSTTGVGHGGPSGPLTALLACAVALARAASLGETVPRVCCPLAGPARLGSW